MPQDRLYLPGPPFPPAVLGVLLIEDGPTVLLVTFDDSWVTVSIWSSRTRTRPPRRPRTGSYDRSARKVGDESFGEVLRVGVA
jgi:hypothetical protein